MEAKCCGTCKWRECEMDDSWICFNINKVKIGKLNYHPSDINWAQFGREAEVLCKGLGLDYYIKDSLRAEMEKC